MPFDPEARLAEWRSGLLDTTKRNRLVKFVTGRVGGIELIHPGLAEIWQRLIQYEELVFVRKYEVLNLPPERLDSDALATDHDPTGSEVGSPVELDNEFTRLCLRSSRLLPTHLLTDLADRPLQVRLTRLYRNALEAQRDHGVTTLLAAFGFLHWHEPGDSAEVLRSPLLLLPVRLSRSNVEAPFTLTALDDEPLVNHCLAELLQTQFRVRLPEPEESGVEPTSAEYPTAYFRAVAERVRDFRGWEVRPGVALGVFNFQKLAMWHDLGQNSARVLAHPVCRAIAGDNTVSLAPSVPLPRASDLDREVPPSSCLQVLDADSSQQEAIEAFKRGTHLVLDGPPGTGKSQTIANIIGETLAAGKTVLFVSEKTAALDVVKKRLDASGLGDFCLELHSHRANKREVIAELGRCLELKPRGTPDVAAQITELAAVRQTLNEYVAELHAVRQPLGRSVFQVHGELARVSRLRGRSRLMIPDVAARDAGFVHKAVEALTELRDCRRVVEEPGGHPWRGCKITTYTHARADEARFTLSRLAEAVPEAQAAADGLAQIGLGENVSTYRTWTAAETLAAQLVELPLFPALWFRADARLAARAVIELDQLTRTARGLVERLPEFDVKPTEPTASVEQLINPNEPERLVNGARLSLRERLSVVEAVTARLRELQTRLSTLCDTATRVGEVLRLRADQTVAELGELFRVAGSLARVAAIPPGWWEASRQQELSRIATRADDLSRRVQELRQQLLCQFPSSAFAPESAPLSREAAAAASSLWHWLPWSNWSKVQARIAVWRAGPPRSGTRTRAELKQLAEYHNLSEQLRQYESAYAGDLLTDASGRTDWTATRTGLADVARLQSWQAGEELRGLLGPGGRLNRDELRVLAEAGLREFTRFQREWGVLVQQLVVPVPFATLTARTDELQVWLRSHVTTLEREAEQLRRTVALLLPGYDLAGELWREKVGRLRELLTTRERGRKAAELANDDRPAAERERTDHGPHATRARILLEFLDRSGLTPSPALAATLATEAGRQGLSKALTDSRRARDRFEKAWRVVTTELFDPSATVSTNITLQDCPLSGLADWASARRADIERLAEWAKFVRVERTTRELGIGTILREVRAGEYGVSDAADAFLARFYSLWLDAWQEKTPALAAFSAETHERLIERFVELDRLAVTTAGRRISEGLVTSPRRPRRRENPPESSELGILQREVNKKQRHLSVRQLFRLAPHVMLRLKPCLMMSPLAVSTYLQGSDIDFDLVIFDEASQVRPHDAICAIYRGRQLVVCGDPKQLPPTDFFNRSADAGEGPDDGDPAGSPAYESLLDTCLALGMPRQRLRWHYRSRREALIAFSNRHFYDGRLVTFPSADEASSPAIDFVRVSEGRFRDGVNTPEARYVARLVLEHARTDPHASLGVIAFSLRQQERILAELEVLRRQHPETEAFFDEERADPFFVKNLENVQGDERDRIVLSIGYGPDETGTVAMRFGPLLQAGGERRLNVAVTRARRQMTVVSSMTAADIDLRRTSAEGARLLKAFLEYAERGVTTLPGPLPVDRIATNDTTFEQVVAEELAAHGLVVHRNVGWGDQRVDIAILDPRSSGRYALGLECDGVSYSSAATARDRDRLRRTVLEGLGWRLLRVWSAEWVRNPDACIRRIMSALQAASQPVPPPDPKTVACPILPWRPPPSDATEFTSIEAVPDSTLAETILRTLDEYGSMAVEDLIGCVSRRLGFKRVGPRIRERIVGQVNRSVSSGALVATDEGRVRPASP
jgi:very-short-patch-repair endonuclease/DNA polymerase III delta prime subunit